MLTLSLDPETLSLAKIQNDTHSKEGTLCAYGIRPKVLEGLSDLLFTGERPRGRDFLRILHAFCGTDFSLAVNEALNTELQCERLYYRNSPLLSEIESTLLPGKNEWDMEDLRGLSLAPDSKAKIIRELGYGSKILDSFIPLWENKPLFEWISKVATELRTNSPSIETLFNIARDGVNLNLSVRTLSDPQSVYFLTYLDYTLRYVIQDVILYHRDREFLQKKADEHRGNEGVIQFIGHMENYLKHQIFLDDHWQELFEWLGGSKQIEKKLIQDQLRNTSSLSSINKELGDPTNQGIVAEFTNFRKSCFQELRSLDSTYPTAFWQQTDVGHCFLKPAHELERLLKYPERVTVGANKNGYSAVILEDSPTQMKEWALMIEEDSPFSVLPDKLCKTPDEVFKHVDDSMVGLFLLDLQNGRDDFAGMKTALKILSKLYGELPQKHNEGDREVNIVLWSSSSVLLNEAAKKIEGFLSEDKIEKISFSRPGRSSSGPYPISLSVIPKWKRPFS